MPEPTLDDVALQLLQLEPQDRVAPRRARERLAEVALTARTGVAAQPYVARAVRALGPLADGTASDSAAAMREVGRLLQCAVEAAAEPAKPERVRPPTDLVEELATAHALLAGDPAFAGLLGRGGEFADCAARLSRAVRMLQRVARDVSVDARSHPVADLGGR